MKKFLFFSFIASTLMLMTSCLDDAGDTNLYISGWGTLVAENSSTVIINVDGAPNGKIILSYDDSSSLTDKSGKLSVSDRLFFNVQYTSGDVTGSVESGVFSIRNAKLYAPSDLCSVSEIITKEQAINENLLAEDSVNTIDKLETLFVLGGYMQVDVFSKYAIITAKNQGIFPTINAVFEPTDDAKVWNVTLLCNHHYNSQECTMSTGYRPYTGFGTVPFRTSFNTVRFAREQNMIASPKDSITMNITYKGVSGETKLIRKALSSDFYGN